MSDNSIYIIGNAHLDPVWLWRWFDGYNEVMQTFRSALDRLSEYDYTVFNCSSASYYKWVENTDPEMFREICERVKEGRWIVVNGWSVQPDCNIPSAESFARQALYSQLYYYDKFGRICHTGYNVDSFGHNGMLPQLLIKGGMRSYVFMRPGMHENANIPEGAFWWESPDGSKVMTYRIHESYGTSGTHDIDKRYKQACERADAAGCPQMVFCGIGNHGGGPTKGDIEHIYNIKQTADRDVRFSSPDEYFSAVCENYTDMPTWKSEMQHHASGCYSATSLVKQLNRQCETGLYSAEAWDAVSAKIKDRDTSKEQIAEAWDTVCFNQFHDILCGCSIMEAYEDLKHSAGHALTVADRIRMRAFVSIAREIDTWIDGISDTVTSEVRHLGLPREFPRPVVVFNSLSYDIETPVRTMYPACRVTDCDGNDTDFSIVRSSRSNDSHCDTVFLAKLPAMGYATYWVWQDAAQDSEYRERIGRYCESRGDEIEIENEYMKVIFSNKTGYIVSLIDKQTGRDFAKEHDLAVPVIIDDSETDTWAHNVFKFDSEMGEMKLVSIELVENGGVRSVVRVKHKFNESVLTQDFILSKKQKTLRVKCKARWSEEFTMLKMQFDIGGKNEISSAQIPAGYIVREPDGDEEVCHQWVDISSEDENGSLGGLSVVNDSKYSYSCKGTQLRQTLLRNVIFADHYSSRPKTDFNFTDEGIQRFEYGIYLHSGEARLSDVAKEAALFNNRPFPVPEGCHKGRGRKQKDSFIKISADNVIMTAFKESEDGSGAYIIRVYETKGIKETRSYLTCELLDCSFWFDIGANEIITFRAEPDGKVSETDFLEGIVDENASV